jgi:trigger factor
MCGVWCSHRYTRSTVQTSVEPSEGNKVKVSVMVDEDEFESAVNAAFTKIASEVRIPGFRPGKAPRKVLEARIGGDYAREEALRSALPDYYEQAVRENDVDVIAAPEIDITAGQESGAVSFDAVVEIRPQIELSGYQDLRVVIPSPTPSDDDVDEQVETLRGQHGELETVDRSAIDGDRVSIDITGTQDGEEIDGLTAEDYLYELGSEAVVPEIDEQLRGTKPGEIL